MGSFRCRILSARHGRGAHTRSVWGSAYPGAAQGARAVVASFRRRSLSSPRGGLACRYDGTQIGAHCYSGGQGQGQGQGPNAEACADLLEMAILKRRGARGEGGAVTRRRYVTLSQQAPKEMLALRQTFRDAQEYLDPDRRLDCRREIHTSVDIGM